VQGLDLSASGEEPLIGTNNTVALVRGQTIPTERPTFVGEVSANFCG
jgi:hypothetical protein